MATERSIALESTIVRLVADSRAAEVELIAVAIPTTSMQVAGAVTVKYRLATVFEEVAGRTATTVLGRAIVFAAAINLPKSVRLLGFIEAVRPARLAEEAFVAFEAGLAAPEIIELVVFGCSRPLASATVVP